MTLTVAALRDAVARVRSRLEGEHEVLSALDGQVGDGDLGITLLKAFRELDRVAPDLPPDLGQALMQGASAVAKVSSSSFGTLLATSLIAAAKLLKGGTELPEERLPELLDAAVAAMSARGKASLGDKTVLDAVAAAADALRREATIGSALRGTDAALAAFRDRPNKIGRARIFAERTVGMDDPGMVAFRTMLDALATPTAATPELSGGRE